MLEKIKHLSSSKQIALSFATVIFIGSILLSLPIAQLPDSQATYIDNLFNAVSAVCVTGLFIESIADSYTLFGKLVMLGLIQVGGLGFMTLFGVFLTFLGKKMEYRQKMAMTDAINYSTIGNTKTFLMGIIKYTFIIELVGAILLSFHFIPERGLASGIFTSIFLSISAFCNAGFDNFGNVSLLNYSGNVLINLVITSLIILGGIGFGVWFDVTKGFQKVLNNKTHRSKRVIFSKLMPHTKLAISMSAIIIVIGTLLFLVIEWQNPNTIKNLPLWHKVLMGYFQTVTMRTAGFATMDYRLAEPSSIVIWVITMFIGGSPGGTAGGLKTTTFAILIMFIVSIIKGSNTVQFNNHSISKDTVRSATVIFTLYMVALVLGSTLIQVFDPTASYLHILFETISALATVGVSASLTPLLSTASHIILMLLMFGGRIGPLTLILSISRNSNKSKDANIQYAETNILIG